MQFIRQRGEKQSTHEKAAEMAVRKPIIHLYRLTSPYAVESSLIIRNKKMQLLAGVIAIFRDVNCNWQRENALTKKSNKREACKKDSQ